MNQADLLAVAAKYPNDKAIQSIVYSIHDAMAMARGQLYRVSLDMQATQEMLADPPTRDITGGFNLQIASSAMTLSGYLTRVSSHYLTLASALQKLGETIEY